ncbi:hypothetical protein HOE425_240013 [Hoeflea sp. EC-HK425]|nr:hypothetical protein HOE425_240013 [Hoeflea sp. EC-HK425]
MAIAVTGDMAAGTVLPRLIHTCRMEAAVAEAVAVVDRGAAALQSRVGREPVRLCGIRPNKCNRLRLFVKMLRT